MGAIVEDGVLSALPDVDVGAAWRHLNLHLPARREIRWHR